MTEKDRAVKLEKKLQQRKLSIYEVLQEDIALQWFKTSNPAFLSMLTPQTMIQIINLLIVPGPPNDKMRSYKIPMIAADMLSTMIPKVYELLFLEDPEQKGAPVLGRLLKYFDSQPNYVISGYVAKILMNLFPANPSRVLEFILRSQPEKMLNFVESHSIVELIIRIIIVEDALLNVQIGARITLFSEIVNQYIENKRSQDQLYSINWMLVESINRLWTLKHKELGRFSGTLFRLVEAVIDQNNLYQQEVMLIAVCKQVSVYQKDAPFLIAALYKKIQQELAQGRGGSQPNVKAKLTSKRYKYLQALYYIIAHGADAIAKQISTSTYNVFPILLEYITKYQWHSLALIEIEKIMKAAVTSNTQAVFIALNKSYLTDKLKELARIKKGQGKNSCGFSGLLTNIAIKLKENLEEDTGFGAWLKKNQSEGELKSWLTEYMSQQQKIQGEEKVRVVHEVTKPFYSISKLSTLFKSFFDQTQAINARMQSESPSKHQEHPTQQKQMMQQIEKQNELVYKWMSQVTNDVLPQDKKAQQANE